jgi:hypothetical protein
MYKFIISVYKCNIFFMLIYHLLGPTMCVCVCVQSWRFSTYKIVSFANRDHFISSFLIQMSFISFSWLDALGRTTSTMLSSSGENENPWFFPNLKTRSFEFFTIDDAVCTGLFIYSFHCVEIVSSIPNKNTKFCQWFFSEFA